MQLTDWLLVEVVLLIISLIKISLENPSFDHLPVIESPMAAYPLGWEF
jgi:hypothetical protein